jgi:hypothetical protein
MKMCTTSLLTPSTHSTTATLHRILAILAPVGSIIMTCLHTKQQPELQASTSRHDPRLPHPNLCPGSPSRVCCPLLYRELLASSKAPSCQRSKRSTAPTPPPPPARNHPPLAETFPSTQINTSTATFLHRQVAAGSRRVRGRRRTPLLPATTQDNLFTNIHSHTCTRQVSE